MYLFFDTETAGLPRRWNAPLSQLSNWPRMVQVGWILCDEQGAVVSKGCRLIRPDGFVIPPDAVARHGITTEYALEHGEALQPVLEDFHRVVGGSDVLVAHNIEFDLKVVGAEFLRGKLENVLEVKPHRCTMKEATNFCQIPGRYGFKWPTLTELHTKLFSQGFTDAHDALADCDACMRCYFALKDRKAIK